MNSTSDTSRKEDVVHPMCALSNGEENTNRYYHAIASRYSNFDEF